MINWWCTTRQRMSIGKLNRFHVLLQELRTCWHWGWKGGLLHSWLVIGHFDHMSLRSSHDNVCVYVQVWNRVQFSRVLWGPGVQLGKQCRTACAVSLGRKPRWHQQGSLDSHTHTHTLWARENDACELHVLESTHRIEAPAHLSGGVSIIPRPNTSLLILTQIVERILMSLVCVHRKNSGIVWGALFSSERSPLYQCLCAESLCKAEFLITCCEQHSRCTVMLFAQTTSKPK